MLGGAELLVRALGRYNTPDTLRAHSLHYLPSIFGRHRLAPDQEVAVDEAWGLRSGQAPSGRTFRINAQGYRGAAVAIPKPPGEVRIVVLGGSSVFDLYATEGQDWPHLVQERLAAPGRRVVVVNAGVPGHASFDSLARLYAQLWTFDPDFVLVYHAWNDIKYFAELSATSPLIGLYKPHDPSADPFQNYRGTADWLLSSSQLYVKARTRYLLRQYRPGLEGAARGNVGRGSYGPMGLEQYRLVTELLVAGTRAIGAVPVLLTEAYLLTPETYRQARTLVALSQDELVRAFADCAETLRAVARDEQVPLLDLAAILNGRADLFADHVHTTAAGSAVLAEAVATFLAPRLPPP